MSCIKYHSKNIYKVLVTELWLGARMYCMGLRQNPIIADFCVDSEGFSGTIWEGFQGDVFLCEILCELCGKVMGGECTVVYIESIAAFAVRLQNLNQPFKWSLPGLRHNLNTERNYYTAVLSELLLPSYLHH